MKKLITIIVILISSLSINAQCDGVHQLISNKFSQSAVDLKELSNRASSIYGLNHPVYSYISRAYNNLMLCAELTGCLEIDLSNNPLVISDSVNTLIDFKYQVSLIRNRWVFDIDGESVDAIDVVLRYRWFISVESAPQTTNMIILMEAELDNLLRFNP